MKTGTFFARNLGVGAQYTPENSGSPWRKFDFPMQFAGGEDVARCVQGGTGQSREERRSLQNRGAVFVGNTAMVVQAGTIVLVVK